MMVIMVDEWMQEVGVAQAKARLSELLGRVARGERFMVARRGKPVAALVPPDQVRPPDVSYLGLAAFAGALEEWDDLPEFVEQVYRDRQVADSRPPPDID